MFQSLCSTINPKEVISSSHIPPFSPWLSLTVGWFFFSFPRLPVFSLSLTVTVGYIRNPPPKKLRNLVRYCLVKILISPQVNYFAKVLVTLFKSFEVDVSLESGANWHLFLMQLEALLWCLSGPWALGPWLTITGGGQGGTALPAFVTLSCCQKATLSKLHA